jgi:hypothetical protein
MQERLEGLKRSASLSSFIIVSSLISLVIVKKNKVLYITLKRMVTSSLSRWKMPSQTGDWRRARGGKVDSSLPRHVRDKNFGFGGHGKRDRQNSRSSTDDLGGSGRRGS